MTEPDDLDAATRAFVTAALDLAIASASRQAGHVNVDAIVTGALERRLLKLQRVSLVKLLGQLGPDQLPAIEDFLLIIGPVMLDDVKVHMAALAAQHPRAARCRRDDAVRFSP